MDNMVNKREYGVFLQEIKQRVYRAQYDALKAVNKELISLYWDIGNLIIERQKRYGWGKSVVEKLAADLQSEFSGMRGFSVSGLWRMRNFYISYSGDEKLAPLVREIGWTHNIVIFERCKNSLEREFYIHMTRKFGWTKNVLIHQIDNQTYEKTVLNQTNFDKALPSRIRSQAKLAVKDEYTFDFLEVGEQHGELEIERALIKKINRFLVEMGGVFMFAGNQFRIEINGVEYALRESKKPIGVAIYKIISQLPKE